MERPSLLRGVQGTLVLCAALTLSGCERAASAAPGPTRPEARPALAVRTVEPTPARHQGRVVVTGDLRSDRAALLGFTVGGRLERIEVRRGQHVQTGQILGALDPALARATAAQARAGVDAAQAQLRLAQDALGRTETLRKQEGVPEIQLLQATAQRDLATAQLAAAQAQADQAEVNLRYHTLRAPFAGVVTQIPPGTGITVGPGTPLFGLESTRELVVDASVTPAQAAALKEGAPVTLTVPATGASVQGTLRAIVPAADPAAHRIPVEIAVANADGRLYPHVLARAELSLGERPALSLPATTLVQRDGALAVWSVDAEQRARKIAVQLLSQEGERALVETDEALVRARVVDLPAPELAEGTGLANPAGGAR